MYSVHEWERCVYNRYCACVYVYACTKFVCTCVCCMRVWACERAHVCVCGVGIFDLVHVLFIALFIGFFTLYFLLSFIHVHQPKANLSGFFYIIKNICIVLYCKNAILPFKASLVVNWSWQGIPDRGSQETEWAFTCSFQSPLRDFQSINQTHRSPWSIGHRRPLAIAFCSGLLWPFLSSSFPASPFLPPCLACSCCEAGLFSSFPAGLPKVFYCKSAEKEMADKCWEHPTDMKAERPQNDDNPPKQTNIHTRIQMRTSGRIAQWLQRSLPWASVIKQRRDPLDLWWVTIRTAKLHYTAPVHQAVNGYLSFFRDGEGKAARERR